MATQAIGILTVLLYAAVGMVILVFLWNRGLHSIRDGTLKTILICAAILGVIGGMSALGYFYPRLPWVWLPCVVLALVAVGEFRRLSLARRHRASEPIDTVAHRVSAIRPVTTTDLICHRYSIEVPKWRGRAFRIALLSDFHVTPALSLDYYKRVLDVAERMEPDIGLMAGDFVLDRDCLESLSLVLRPVGKLGAFAVLGNHDYWSAAEEIAEVVKKSGVRLLHNESVSVVIDEVPLTITGSDEPWGPGRPADLRVATDTPHFVLTHSPDNIYRMAGSSVDCVFSGHYHAGQFRIPFVGPIVIPSVRGRHFDHGHFKVNGTHLFVTSGVGCTGLQLRLYCQPDIFMIDIAGG